MNAEEYRRLAQEAKENADRCQVHKPAHAALMAKAQYYPLCAIYEQNRQPVTQL